MTKELSAYMDETGNVIIDSEKILKIVEREAEKGKYKPKLTSVPDINIKDRNSLTNLSTITVELAKSEVHSAAVKLLEAIQGEGGEAKIVYPYPIETSNGNTDLEDAEEQPATENIFLDIVKLKGKITPEQWLETCRSIQERYPKHLTQSLERLFKALKDEDPEEVDLDEGEPHEIEIMRKAKVKIAELALLTTKLSHKGITEPEALQERNKAADELYKQLRAESLEDTKEIFQASTLPTDKKTLDCIREHERLCRGICSFAMVTIPVLEKLVEKKVQKKPATKTSDTAEMDPMEIPGAKAEGPMDENQIAELLAEEEADPIPTGKIPIDVSNSTDVEFEELPMPENKDLD